ncbi:MAG: early set domain-containing protein, partial [Leptospirales bacterium]
MPVFWQNVVLDSDRFVLGSAMFYELLRKEVFLARPPALREKDSGTPARPFSGLRDLGPLGAVPLGGGQVLFRVWAPSVRKVELFLEGPERKAFEMEVDSDG